MPRLRLSSVNELSFLPISRPRPVPSATQLSSIHGLPAAGSHVHAAWEPAGGVGRASSRAIFIVTSNHLAARETGKTGTAAVAGCQRRFLSAGQKHGSRNLRCHGTAVFGLRLRMILRVFGPTLRVVPGLPGRRAGGCPREGSCCRSRRRGRCIARAGISVAAFEVGYVCGDGAEHRVPLAGVLAVSFEQGLPVHRFASQQGRRHLSGLWRACRVRVLAGTTLLALDFDPAVTGIASQPFWLCWTGAADGRASHAPDYFARRADGSAVVVDCRPAERRKPRTSASSTRCRPVPDGLTCDQADRSHTLPRPAGAEVTHERSLSVSRDREGPAVPSRAAPGR